MEETIICDRCKKEMILIGNISNIYYTSIPVQWDDVYVCRTCETKKNVRRSNNVCLSLDYSYLDEYEDITPKK